MNQLQCLLKRFLLPFRAFRWKVASSQPCPCCKPLLYVANRCFALPGALAASRTRRISQMEKQEPIQHVSTRSYTLWRHLHHSTSFYTSQGAAGLKPLLPAVVLAGAFSLLSFATRYCSKVSVHRRGKKSTLHAAAEASKYPLTPCRICRIRPASAKHVYDRVDV